MGLDTYTQKIFALLQKHISVSSDELLSAKLLHTLGNVPEHIVKLNYFLSKGDIEGIEQFISYDRKLSYDDYSYWLFSFKSKNVLISVWDSDELWDDPQILLVKEIPKG